MTETVVVIDFETTGFSPAKGARATEVAAVRLIGDEIVDSFQSLMNTGTSIPPQIESLTGITNAMVRSAPPATRVMRQLAAFINGSPLVAHNARFDQTFLEAELDLLRLSAGMRFACTIKLAKRIYPRAPSYKLEALLEYADVPHQDNFHRALSDAMATANLWLQMKRDLGARIRINTLNHEVMNRIASQPDYWLRLSTANQKGHRCDG